MNHSDPAVRALWKEDPETDSTSNDDATTSAVDSESLSSPLRTTSSTQPPPLPYLYPEGGGKHEPLRMLPNAEVARMHHSRKRRHDLGQAPDAREQEGDASAVTTAAVTTTTTNTTTLSPRRSPKRHSPSTESATYATETKATVATHHRDSPLPAFAGEGKGESKPPAGADLHPAPTAAEAAAAAAAATARQGMIGTSTARHDQSPNDQPAAVTQTRSTRSAEHGRRVTSDTQLKQPRTLKISQSQLAEEIRGIYAGLAVVEAKCRALVEAHVRSLKAAAASHAAGQPVQTASKGRWAKMVALHRTLLHEHHDFLLASQHPVASPSMKNLAKQHSIPGRLWRYGIHSFLELMRHHLPETQEFLLEFLLLAFQMVALLYETVPAFADTWLECLGDLSRYRMAVENNDERDRSTWASTSRYWYTHARDNNPGTGRILHHLAVLSRSHTLQQMAFYAGALTTVDPFPAAKDSMQTLIGPILARAEAVSAPTLSPDLWYVKALAILLVRQSLDRYRRAARNFLSLLDSHISRSGDRFRGAYLALTSIAAVLDYGGVNSPVWVAFEQVAHAHKAAMERQASTTAAEPAMEPAEVSAFTPAEPVVLVLGAPPVHDPNSRTDADSHTDGQLSPNPPNIEMYFPFACQLLFRTLAIVLRHGDEAQTQPYVHVALTFLLAVGSLENGTHFLEPLMPWDGLATYLNALPSSDESAARIEADAFPQPTDADRHPLLEDYLLQGLIYTTSYFPAGWFNVSSVDQDSRFVESDLTAKHRAERVRWLGCQVAKLSVRASGGQPWLSYDSSSRTFSVTVPDADMEDEKKPALWLLGATLDGNVSFDVKTEPAADVAPTLASKQAQAQAQRYSLERIKHEEQLKAEPQDVTMGEAGLA